MELNQRIIETPPRDAASIVLVRDGQRGLEVLLMRRHSNSQVLGGAYVFPGGKLDRDDASPAAQARLDAAPTRLHAALNEPALDADRAAGLFVCALREAFEESGVLFASKDGVPLAESERRHALDAVHAGTSFASVLAQNQWQLDTRSLVPWSRWITPRRPSHTEKRFDTRFFLASMPGGQRAEQDEHEITEARWITPRQGLVQYRDRQIDLIAPQIIGLMHLMGLPDVASALADARSRMPPLIEPHVFDQGDERVLCYPGDPEHPVQTRALPATTRLIWRNQRFHPPEGLDAFLA